MAVKKTKSQRGSTSKNAARRRGTTPTSPRARTTEKPTSSGVAARRGGTVPERKRASKQVTLINRLTRPAGARIADLVQELGWLPHTVRAALTGLRRKGYAVTRSKDGDGETVYRATAPKSAKTQARSAAKKAA